MRQPLAAINRSARTGMAFVGVGAALLLSACGTSSPGRSASGAAFSSTAPIRGQHITVLLPYTVPRSILNQFTAQTGVDVTFDTAGWDNVKSKLIVANSASTYIADVTEFDWTFTGQFGGAGWYVPLEKGLGARLLNDLGPVNRAFDTNGHTYAACYSNDYRLSLYNKKDFAAAGLKQFPTTFAQLSADMTTLQHAKAAAYPISLPLAATEGGLTPWYLLTLAMGGHLFNSHNQPVFGQSGSTAYKALRFEIEALKKGWITPGSVTLDDTPAFNNFVAGESAMLFAGGPGNISIADDPSQSKIAGHVGTGLIPGMTGPGPSFGLPEGLAIPVTARHKTAALAFIKWWLQPKTQIELYTNGVTGFLPCRLSVLHTLTRTGKLKGGSAVLKELDHIEPLFPKGAPRWYSQFDTDAQGLINSAVEGKTSPTQALQQLSSEAKSLASSAG